MARVLVVDDDHTVREVVVSYLRAGRHDVDEAADGETALESMRARPADLVVLDLMLPGIDGLEVCRRLRETSDVPVIMLTALGGETDRVVGLEQRRRRLRHQAVQPARAGAPGRLGAAPGGGAGLADRARARDRPATSWSTPPGTSPRWPAASWP